MGRASIRRRFSTAPAQAGGSACWAFASVSRSSTARWRSNRAREERRCSFASRSRPTSATGHVAIMASKTKREEKGATVVRVVLVDDHPIVREGLKQLVNAQPDMRVIGEAADGEDA